MAGQNNSNDEPRQFTVTPSDLPMNTADELLTLDTVGGLGRWYQQRMSRYSSAKETFVLISTLMVGFIGGPALVFYLMTWSLAGNLGTSGGGAAALAFNGCLYLLLLALAMFLGGLVVQNLCRPTHLAIDSNGIRYGYRTGIGFFKGRTFSWPEIERIEIIKPVNTVNPEKYIVRFQSRLKKKFDLPLRWLENPEAKEKLANAVDLYLADVDRDLDAAFFLQSPSSNSFTELWFQALDSPFAVKAKLSSPE